MREPEEFLRQRMLAPSDILTTILDYARKNGFLLKANQILDIGCGSGSSPIEWPRKEPRGNRVGHGPGLSKGLFQRSAGGPGPGRGQMQVHPGSAYRLGFRDGSFDLVVSTAVLEHLDNLEEAFREIHRVLRPGLSIHFTILISAQGGHGLLSSIFRGTCTADEGGAVGICCSGAPP